MKNETAKKSGLAVLLLAVLAIGALFWFGPKTGKNDDQLNVFAASSFAWVLRENADLIEQETGLKLVIVEAASSTLARQISEGAPGDIFITADAVWLDYLVESGLESKPVELARNTIVMVFSGDGEAFLNEFIDASLEEKEQLGKSYKFITGDPAYVPLGKYVRQALEKKGFWEDAKESLIPALDARIAIKMLEEGLAPFGYVYKTDALFSEQIIIIEEIPENSHSPIIYWAVALKDSNEVATENFFNFLKSEAFRTILQDNGFETN